MMFSIEYRAVLTACLASSVLLFSSKARAQASDDDKSACVASFSQAQKLRDKGKLVAARTEMIACAQQQCPSVIRDQCSQWLRDIEPMVPSVVFSAKRGNTDVVDVAVTVDGNTVVKMLDGRPVMLDPGPHTVTFELEGSDPISKDVLVTQGETNRRVEVLFVDPSQPEPEAPATGGPGDRPVAEGGVSPLVFVGFGMAGAGVIVGAITGGVALSKGSEFNDNCPSEPCDTNLQGDFDSGRTIAHVSTAAFAIAGAGAVVGVIGLLTGDDAATEVGELDVLAGPTGILVRGRF